jgi:hypothetical protein
MNLSKPKPHLLNLHAALSEHIAPVRHSIAPVRHSIAPVRPPIAPPVFRAPPPRRPVLRPPVVALQPTAVLENEVEVSALIPPAKDYNLDGIWAVLVKVPSPLFQIAQILPSTNQYMQMDPDLLVSGVYSDGVKNALYSTTSPSIPAFDIGKIALNPDPGTPAGRWLTIEVMNQNRRELPFFVRLRGSGLATPVSAEIVDARTAVARSQGFAERPSR